MSIEKQAREWAAQHDIKLTKQDLERLHELASKPHARILISEYDCEVSVTEQPVTDRLVLHAVHKRCFNLNAYGVF